MKILIAEDEELMRLWLETVLGMWGYECISYTDGEQAWRVLQQPDAPQLAIIDWEMPKLDGIEVCRRVRADPDLRYTYIIMLTGKSETADIVEALQAGADDFIVKPCHPEELKVRLRAGSRIVQLQEELLLKASHDQLTGIFNRGMLMEMAARELDRTTRTKAPLSLLLLDIDFFKHINDRYGHQAGDAVLRETALCIKSDLRGIDIAGRYGGEEFMVVLPHCDTQAAFHVAERLRTKLTAHSILYSGTALKITVSIGVASGTAPAVGLEDLFREADRALYRAKNAGRNRVEVAG